VTATPATVKLQWITAAEHPSNNTEQSAWALFKCQAYAVTCVETKNTKRVLQRKVCIAASMDQGQLSNSVLVPVVNRVGPLGDPPLAASERVCSSRIAARILRRRARRRQVTSGRGTRP
jgi:hypothetical protein